MLSPHLRRRVTFRVAGFLLVAVRFLAVFFALLLRAGFFFCLTRSGNSLRPVERFHSSYVSGEISPLTSSSANLRRWALLLNGMVPPPIVVRGRLFPFGNTVCRGRRLFGSRRHTAVREQVLQGPTTCLMQ